jgi:hypothetical protein
MRKIDFSRATALHRLYGHYIFVMEATKSGKDKNFISNICMNLKCNGKSNDWRSNLPLDIKY